MEEQHFEQRIDLTGLTGAIQQIKDLLATVIVGQRQMVDLLIAGILADGHILIEGVPGVAKTLTAKLIAQCIDAKFSRIQFTPDLMPSDVLGTSVFNPKENEFSFKPGPIFGHVILVDEINRAPAKTQAALFEVMEERQVTLDGHTYLMDEPFVVLATQNPIEQEGTYRLPEAQLDRFLVKIEVGYPTLEEETQILANHHTQKLDERIASIKPILSTADIRAHRKTVKSLHIEDNLLEFIARIVHETRNHKSIYLGASPRASLAIANTAKAIAVMDDRDFITPDDVIRVAPAVLRHRLILTPEREMEGLTTDDIVAQIIKEIAVPR